MKSAFDTENHSRWKRWGVTEHAREFWLNMKKGKYISSQIGQWRFSKSLNIFDSAHAILVLTEWEEYRYIEWDKVAKKMVKPSWVFDSRSITDPNQIKKSGLNLWRIGDGYSN